MEEIVSQLEAYNKAYREGKPIVPDSVYDALLEELPTDHPYRNQVESEELYKGRIKHNKPMLSMQKAKTEVEIERWVNSVCKATATPPKDIMIRCSAKLDGIAGKFEDKKLTTRGDGRYGNDVTSAFDKGIVSIIPDYNLTLGEFVVKLDYFKKHLSDAFSHPRNFVSGAIMADTLNSVSQKAFNNGAVVFQAYSDLPNKILPIFPFLKDFRAIEEFISNSVNYPIDGVIFEVVNPSVKKEMGEAEYYPHWAIALKPKDKVYESIVTNIRWQTGRTGKVTPVVIIEPTIIDGVEVRRASAHNAKMVKTMGLSIGSRIELIRSGSVIPYIVRVIKNE